MSDEPLARLRAALSGSSEALRPVAALDLPPTLRELMTADNIAALKQAAVLIPVLMHEAAATILLTRRADTLRQHRGQISFPGGRRDDADLNITAAALREAQEEVGLAPQAVEVLGYLDDHPTFSGYRITPVVGVVAGAFTLQANPQEVAEAFELPLAYLFDDARFERKQLSTGGHRVPYLELRHGEYVIWGVTAGILWNLHQRLIET